MNLDESRIEVVESVAEVSGRIYFGPTKTYQARDIAVPAFLKEMLDVHRGEPEPDDFVFQAPGGGILRHANFRNRVWLPAIKEAGLQSLRIHDLRHTCVALLIAQGAHPKAIQAHLGHSSITVTLDTYGHLFCVVVLRAASHQASFLF